MTPIPGLISIVIVNWNGMSYLPECIEYSRRQEYSNKELVVVDNGSTDGSLGWLRSRGAGIDSLVELDHSTGFAAGVNAGILASQGEFIALLNNDAVPAIDWLTELARSAQESSAGMVASKILFYDRRHLIDKVGHLLYPDGLNRGRGAGEPDAGQYD